MTLFFVPIEPYDTRYTAQWYQWFQEEFKKEDIDYQYIDGEILSDQIESGSVLDAEGSNYYKFSQLQRICRMIKDRDINDNDQILFADGWFPGIEAIKYISNIKSIRIRLYSIFHAGTYDPYDFTTRANMNSWGKCLEEAWFNIYDKIFVATEYHRMLILKNRKCNYNKITITGLPIDMEIINQFSSVDKDDIVVFPHRLDLEKNVHLFDRLEREVKKEIIGIEFIKTMEHNLSKNEYYRLLGRSKVSVSYADQETFGYGMIESSMLGCKPVVPNRLSYIDIFPDIYRFESFERSKQMVIEGLKSVHTEDHSQFLYHFSKDIVIKKIIEQVVGK